MLEMERMENEMKLSIPSRRVGDQSEWKRVIRALVPFHPLKAGRRLPAFTVNPSSLPTFHPLKAGRRLKILIQSESEVVLSIPSRRVGD